MTIELEIVATPGLAWIQDAGRPGQMVHGVPPGGALVPERLAVANGAVGNGRGAAAVEAFGGLVVAARGGDLRVAWGGEGDWLLRDHVRVLAAAPGDRVAYLAVAGGLDVPVVLGGRGLLPVAGLGGGVGRPLRAGDRIGVGEGGGLGIATGAFSPGLDAPIRVVAGPDLDRFSSGAWGTLLGTAWRIGAASDRVGMRLAGPAIPRTDGDAALSTPMVQGALQVPAGGAPIVLGPDHPTTGGYPVIAVVIRADLGALLLREPGARVVFEAIGVAEAREARARWVAAWRTPGLAG
ncbi:MAG: allophanate hydrolase subunit 2 family protein [Pseudomonadota bacterium]|nr:allophanate hydrolase subunit 2 family protein [Pseudomonadota bacterium]